MNGSGRRDRLQGIVVSVPTPCNSKFEIEHGKLGDHIAWLVESGIREGTGVVMAAGGIGEGYFLSSDEHRGVMKTLVDAAGGRVPTMTGVFELSTRAAVERARFAEDAGIDFLQVNPPHYMKPSDDEVFRHVQMINDAADVGIMVYNTPWAMPQGYEITPELLARLAELESVMGVKWASFDMGNFLRGLRLFANRFNFIDNQLAFSIGHMLGMKGFISFIANFAPELEIRLWGLLQRREYERYNEEYGRTHFDPFAELRHPEEPSWSGVGEGSIGKAVMEIAGKPFGPPFPPQVELPKAEKERLRRAYVKAGVIRA